MTKRLVLALVIALLISGLFTYFLSRRVAKAARLKGPQQQFCVAAAKPLDAGEVLTAQDLQVIEWHAPSPLSEGFGKVQELVGRVILYPLPKDEPIIERQLAAAGSGAGLTSKIPAGMRAISDRFTGCRGSHRWTANSPRSGGKASHRQCGDSSSEAGGCGKDCIGCESWRYVFRAKKRGRFCAGKSATHWSCATDRLQRGSFRFTSQIDQIPETGQTNVIRG